MHTPSSSFDRVAREYDRARPAYPEAVFDRIVAFAGLDAGSRLLEIGSGTGKAALPFARRGFRLLGLEPGEALAQIARAALADFAAVEIRTTRFEDWSVAAGAFDLVFAAQSFHWLDPAKRLSRVAAALRANGALAVFGNSPTTVGDPSHERIQVAYRHYAPALCERDAAQEWYGSTDSPVVEELRQSGLFANFQVELFAWQRSLTSAEYAELLGTYSDHSALPSANRTALIDTISDVVRDNGDALTLRYRTALFLARKK